MITLAAATQHDTWIDVAELALLLGFVGFLIWLFRDMIRGWFGG